MLALLKAIGAPGSIGFLAMCSALGLILARASPRTRPIGRMWLLTVYLVYVALGLPYVANHLAAGLSSYQPIADLTSLQGTDAIIVLDGDNRLGRLRETRRLFEATSPRWVIASGSEWLMTSLIETGIPADRLMSVGHASTTLDQMRELPRLPSGQARRVVIVASRLQMPRVAALARATGFQATLAPSPIDDEPPTRGWQLFVPRYVALRVSRDAIYEIVALAYYRRQGWIR